MSLTNRGIWSPDDSDNFDMTVDLGAMAESIDNAIDDVETDIEDSLADNYPPRFNTLSALQAWTPADGAIAFVTSDNRYYVRVSGSWRTLFEESDWIDLPINGGTGMCRYMIFSGQVRFKFDVRRSSGNMADGTSWDPLTTIPTAVRPSEITVVPSWGGSVRSASCAIRSDGTVLWRNQGSPTDRAVGSATWILPT